MNEDIKLKLRKFNKEKDNSQIDSWFEKDSKAAYFLSFGDDWAYMEKSIINKNIQDGFEQVKLTKKEIKSKSKEKLRIICEGKKFQVLDYVLEINGNLAGVILLELKNEDLKVSSIFINPKLRKKHIARKMIKILIEAPEKYGIVLPYTKLKANIFDDNIASKRLFSRFGFICPNKKYGLCFYEKDTVIKKENGIEK